MKHITIYKTVAILLFVMLTTGAKAQKVSILDGGIAFPIQAQQTQTETKPGWQIADISGEQKPNNYQKTACHNSLSILTLFYSATWC